MTKLFLNTVFLTFLGFPPFFFFPLILIAASPIFLSGLYSFPESSPLSKLSPAVTASAVSLTAELSILSLFLTSFSNFNKPFYSNI